MAGGSIQRADQQAGFTLIEVLVSLAIFSLAIVGLNRAAALAVSGTATLQAKTHAGFVADNAVVLSRITPVEVGTERSQAQSGGMNFDVSIVTSETELANFYQIEVEVRETNRDRVLIERRAFRYQTSTVAASVPQEDEE